jgi:ElaB/YqjD/DUF883 family membrane-anchored ribosome-binding protein
MATTTQKDKDRMESERKGSGDSFQDPNHGMGKSGTGMAQKIGDEAKRATDKAESMAGNVMDKAKEAGSFISEKADQATGAVGSSMESLGHSLREHTPQGGMVGAAGEAVATRLEQGGRYLEQHGMGDMAGEISTMIRRNPLPAVLIGIGVGFFLARLTRS